ncbi:MAG: GGDEF domain-containing protein [Pseudomonadota bacterium]
MRGDGKSQKKRRISFTELSRPGALVTACVLVWFVPSVQAMIPAHQLETLKWSVLVLTALALVVLGLIIIDPSGRKSRRGNVRRYYVSTLLDCLSVAVILYLGESVFAPMAAMYLWCIVGRGFVGGVKQMFVAAFVSLCSFGMVYYASPYWRSEPVLSLTVTSVIVLLVPFLALLLQRTQRAERLARFRADHDSLTRMLNRRAFRERLDLALTTRQHDERKTQTDFLMFIDLDRFKAVNDEAGHAAGDQALKDISKLVRSVCEQDDFAGRMGGDEFCVFLFNRNEKDAEAIAEKLRAKVDAYRLKWGAQYFSLGASIGLASTASTTQPEKFIRLADAACYAAKNNGRNQVHSLDENINVNDTVTIRKLKLPGGGSSQLA